eukprot:TRINITY_DN7511_c0_g1_i2.p1 TRINITY_DN7511_c0_g1~~TRINITY_DN7511_c0_g1_i2.p1  ORF type:complete len:147 (-),score=24.89 TRINITY_DN7511_c0_g1_i2:87-527(-)
MKCQAVFLSLLVAVISKPLHIYRPVVLPYRHYPLFISGSQAKYQFPWDQAQDHIFQCPPGGGVFPHGEECSKYYVCSDDGRLQGESECPAGMYFDPAFGVCDIQANVECYDFKQESLENISLTLNTNFRHPVYLLYGTAPMVHNIQ